MLIRNWTFRRQEGIKLVTETLEQSLKAVQWN